MALKNCTRNIQSIGFANHARMAFTCEPELLSGKEYKINRCEKIGRILNWCVTELPKKIVPAFHNPKVITVALTALALLTVQFTFYPRITYFAVKTICLLVAKRLPAHVIKISIYAFIQINILGYGITAFGRFSNEELMKNWYKRGCPEQV